MFSITRSVLCATAVALALVASAAATDLATFDIIDQGGGLGDMTGLRLSILDQFPGIPSPTYQIGDYLTITPADVGSTFTITTATDPDFDLFKQLITNGSNNGFGYYIIDLPSAGGVGQLYSEAGLFAAGTHSFGPGNFSSIGTLSGPDFAGYDITAVTLTINSFGLISGGGSNSHDFRAAATIVATPVPEPSLDLLVLTGGALAWRWSRLRRSERGRCQPPSVPSQRFR